MLDKIKQWTLRILGPVEAEAVADTDTRCRDEAQGLESALRGLQQCRLDPRELPRPHRHTHTHQPASGGGSQSSDSRGQSDDEAGAGTGVCSCRNCCALAVDLLECAICLEPLGRVTSCAECGNVSCFDCAARLPRCPYCRASPGLLPNSALQRLLNRLDIPCNNSILPVRCPHKKCSWRGEIDGLASHLEQSHLVTILNGSSVTLDIAEFQRKAELSETRQRHYSVLLACYSDVFLCRVNLHHKRLKVVLSQLNGTGAKQSRLGAWVEISSAAKTMKGIIPLSKAKSDMEVPITHFLSPNKGDNDRVSISINIRPLS